MKMHLLQMIKIRNIKRERKNHLTKVKKVLKVKSMNIRMLMI